jgi:signal-transduction protein with cAMP-binding, CBS, and nucleotidyltransferase domain
LLQRASIYEAIAIMAETSIGALPVIADRRLAGIRHLPVVEHGQVVGIVSIGDLVRQEYISGRSFVAP